MGIPNVLDNEDWPPIHYLIKYPSKYSLKEIHELSLDLNQRNSEGNTLLETAIIQGDYIMVDALLSEPDLVRINEKNKSGLTPLHLAMECLHLV